MKGCPSQKVRNVRYFEKMCPSFNLYYITVGNTSYLKKEITVTNHLIN